MKGNFYYIIFFFILFFEISIAQSPDWLWAKSIGGTSFEYSYSITTDASGYVYTTGYFHQVIDFDPGPAVYNLGSPTGQFIYISKFSNSGNLVWARAFGGTGYNTGASIIIDPSTADVYITGAFGGTVDFDPDTGIYNLTAKGGIDIFICKLDSAGNFVWAKAMGGLGYEVGLSIAVDSTAGGGIYVTGTFDDKVDFDPGSGVFSLISNGSTDFFVSKLDTSGNMIWTKATGGPESDYVRQIVLGPPGSGDLYLTGWFSDTVDFDSGLGTLNLISSGGYDIYIVKMNNAGNMIWSKRFGGILYDKGMSIAVDTKGSGTIYETGVFYETVDFDPGSGTFNLVATVGDIFVSKYDSSGNFIWAKSFGGPMDDYGFSIALDPMGTGDVYTTGYFQQSTDFDPGPGTYHISSVGNTDIFISKLDSAGNFVWVKAMGGYEPDVGLSVTLNHFGNIFLTGMFFSASMQLGVFTLTNANNFGGSSDIFISKLDHFTTEVESIKNSSSFSIYPNPTSGNSLIYFDSFKKITKVSVIDITGKIIFASGEQSTSKFEISSKDFAEGVYLIRIQEGDYTETKKLIVIR